MTATACSILFFCQTALGCGWGGHHARPVSACCDVCGVESAKVFSAIRTLQAHPRWRTRDDAAHDLRKFDWRCHPEILAALSHALLTDCEEEVREEAAEALAKIEPPPCSPEVHAALDRAALCDPDHATRKQARKALARLGRRCVAPCSVCGPEVVGGPGPHEVIVTPAFEPGATIVGPSVEVAPYARDLPPPTVYGPDFDGDGLDALPPPEPMPPASVPPANIPPLPPDASSPFDPTPEARRPVDDRITARPTGARDRTSERVASRPAVDEEDDEPRGRSAERSPRRPRLLPFSILGRRGR